MSEYPHPQLVRVQWRNMTTRRIKTFVAGVVAYDDDDALDVCDAIVRCMVPTGLNILVRFQTIALGREATARDAYDPSLRWRTLWKGTLGYQSKQLERAK